MMTRQLLLAGLAGLALCGMAKAGAPGAAFEAGSVKTTASHASDRLYGGAHHVETRTYHASSHHGGVVTHGVTHHGLHNICGGHYGACTPVPSAHVQHVPAVVTTRVDTTEYVTLPASFFKGSGGVGFGQDLGVYGGGGCISTTSSFRGGTVIINRFHGKRGGFKHRGGHKKGGGCGKC